MFHRATPLANQRVNVRMPPDEGSEGLSGADHPRSRFRVTQRSPKDAPDHFSLSGKFAGDPLVRSKVNPLRIGGGQSKLVGLLER